MNTVFQAQKVTKQTAASVAKRVAQEHLEVLQSAKAQVGLPSQEVSTQQPENTGPMPALNDEAGPDPYEEVKLHSEAQSKQLLQNLEAELKSLREKRNRDNEQRQAQALGEQNQQVIAPLGELPQSSKPKGGFRGKMQAVKTKLSSMASKGEKQRNVSG